MESAPRLRIAFAGTFAARLEAPVRARLTVPFDIVVDDEHGIVAAARRRRRPGDHGVHARRWVPPPAG